MDCKGSCKLSLVLDGMEVLAIGSIKLEKEGCDCNEGGTIEGMRFECSETGIFVQVGKIT